MTKVRLFPGRVSESGQAIVMPQKLNPKKSGSGCRV